MGVLALQEWKGVGCFSGLTNSSRWYDRECGEIKAIPKSSNCDDHKKMAFERITELSKDIWLWNDQSTPRILGKASVQNFVRDKARREVASRLQEASKALADAAEKVQGFRADSMLLPAENKRKYDEAFEGIEEMLAETSKDVMKHKSFEADRTRRGLGGTGTERQ